MDILNKMDIYYRQYPAFVMRHFSKWTNSNGDFGLFIGNWDLKIKSYEICSSIDSIFKNYLSHGKPIYKGQCNDLNAILCCILRMIGIGSRSVTGIFINAKPNNYKGDISFYIPYVENLHMGNKWAYHTWLNTYCTRSDILQERTKNFTWQYIDATPFDSKEGFVPFGPFQLEFLKNESNIFYNFDGKETQYVCKDNEIIHYFNQEIGISRILESKNLNHEIYAMSSKEFKNDDLTNIHSTHESLILRQFNQRPHIEIEADDYCAIYTKLNIKIKAISRSPIIGTELDTFIFGRIYQDDETILSFSFVMENNFFEQSISFITDTWDYPTFKNIIIKYELIDTLIGIRKFGMKTISLLRYDIHLYHISMNSENNFVKFVFINKMKLEIDKILIRLIFADDETRIFCLNNIKSKETFMNICKFVKPILDGAVVIIEFPDITEKRFIKIEKNKE